VENVYITYNFSHFAMYLPKLIKIHKFDEVLTETKMHSFFETQCRICIICAVMTEIFDKIR